jgi:hypothetical protein
MGSQDYLAIYNAGFLHLTGGNNVRNMGIVKQRWFDSPWLFALAAMLPLIPVWTHPYLLTHDGTAHLASAKLILDMLRGTCGEITRLVQFSPSLPPNWTGHALMAAMMAIGIPPFTAEKLLMSVCVMGWAFAARALIGAVAPQGKWTAWFALPVGWNYFTMGGGYNFSLSCILAVLLVARWISGGRDAAGMKWTLAVTAWCVAIYFSHPFGLLVVAGFVGLTETVFLWKTRAFAPVWRRVLPFLPAAALCAALLAHYAHSLEPLPFSATYSFTEQLAKIFQPFARWLTYQYLPISNVPRFQWETAALTFWLVMVLAMLYFEGRKKGVAASPYPLGAFVVLLLLVAGLLPPVSLGGWAMAGRFYMIATLFACAWLATREAAAPRGVPGITALVATATMLVLTVQHQQRSDTVSQAVEASLPDPSLLQSAGTVLTINLTPWGERFENGRALDMVPAVYAGHWLTLPRCTFDYNNYELNSKGVFPLSIRPEHYLTPVWSNIVTIEGVGSGSIFPYGAFDLNMLPPERLPDYVLVWGGGDSEVTPQSVAPEIHASYVEYPLFRRRLDRALASRYEAVYRSPAPNAGLLNIYSRK